MITQPLQAQSHLTPQRSDNRREYLPACFSLRPSNLCAAAFWAICLSALCPSLFAAPPPELTILRQQYDKTVAERVTAPFEASLAELNTKYLGGLDRAIAEAKAAGKLEDILALEAEKKRLADKLPVPASEDDAEPASLKKLRPIYREQFKKLEDTRTANHQTFLPAYTAKLQALEATLVKADRVDEAKEVLAYRQGLSTTPSVPAPTAASAPALPSPANPMPEAPKVKGDDRKAAEWILANWSDFRLFIDDHKGVSKAEGLPKGKFTIESIAIDGRFYTGGTLTGEALQVLAGLQDLKSLTLGNFPDLKDTDLAFLSSLTGLEELKLSKVAFTDSFIAYLTSLKKLQRLDYGELPNLTGVGFAQLQGLPVLESIKHWKGGCTDEGIAAIAKLPGITILDFGASAAVTNPCIRHLEGMKKLKQLFISGSSITPDGLTGKPLEGVVALGANELGKAPLREIAPKLALMFPNVVHYHLSYDVNTPEDMAALAHFKKLKKFSNFGEMKDDAVPGILELRDLEAFIVETREITDTTWQTLARLKKLKLVRYGNKPPNAAALAAFKKERPDVKVEP